MGVRAGDAGVHGGHRVLAVPAAAVEGGDGQEGTAGVRGHGRVGQERHSCSNSDIPMASLIH